MASFLQGKYKYYLQIVFKGVLISFREWLHSYKWYPQIIVVRKHSSSHLFQRVASFLRIIKLIHGVFDRLGFSSLSESGFIPTFLGFRLRPESGVIGSHLFQRVASFLLENFKAGLTQAGLEVLISFREWLHSYWQKLPVIKNPVSKSSHLFQRVASFLHTK